MYKTCYTILQFFVQRMQEHFFVFFINSCIIIMKTHDLIPNEGVCLHNSKKAYSIESSYSDIIKNLYIMER